MSATIDAVVFDFHGTLARPAEGELFGYGDILSKSGYPVDERAIATWSSAWEGREHDEHSTDRGTYAQWWRSRLRQLADSAGVPEERADLVVDRLLAWDDASYVAYPEAADVLRALRAAGVRIGACSNWGWHLDPFLEQCGLLPYVDAAVCSARVGARKPHRRVYERALDALGVRAPRAWFVGDNMTADVLGPLDADFDTAVHVWRLDRGSSDHLAPLPLGSHRVSDLTGILDLLWDPRSQR